MYAEYRIVKSIIPKSYSPWPWSYGSWIYTIGVVSSNLDQGEVYNIMR
jgi:hypothetical protein